MADLKEKKYKAVDWSKVQSLGGSPMNGRNGYVIGPDITGRICHVATCFTMTEAKKLADKYNNRPIK